MTHWLFECEGPSRESLWCVCMRVSHFGLCLLCGRVPWMSDFPATSTEKPVLILPSRATASPRTAGNADDHLTHSETISSIWGQINMQRKSPCGPFPWMLFPALLSSCCPVTRCRGRQVYLVWQVTLHPEPPQSHVKLTLMHQQLPSYGGQNTIMLKCITHFYELFSCIMLLPSPLLAGACRGMDLPRLIPLWMPGLIPLLLPYLLGVRFQTHPNISLDGPLSWWDKRHLKNTNHCAALGFPAALEMEGEEISRGQLLRLWLLISIDRIHIKGGKQA